MGQIFGNLTRTGVEGPAVSDRTGWTPPYSPGRKPQSGGTTYFDNPAEAAIHAAKNTVVPTSTINPESGQVSKSGGFNPTIRKPSFAEAGKDGPLSPALTTKGRVLGLLLNAAQGAAVGAGSNSFGEGFQRGAIFPLQQKQRQQQILQEEQEAEQRRQAIEQAPVLFRDRQENLRANTEYLRAGTGKREQDVTKVVPGVGLVNVETGRVITEEKRTPSAPRTVVTGRKVMQFNPATNKYDIEVGPAPERQSGSGGEKPATRAQRAALERWKASEHEQHLLRLQALQKKIADGDSTEDLGTFDREGQKRIEDAYNIQKAQLGIEDAPPKQGKGGGKLFDLRKDKIGAEDQERPVYVNGKLAGYTKDGKTMRPAR